MESAELSTMLKPFFTQKLEKSVEEKPYSHNTVKAKFVPGWTDFFLVLFKEIIPDKVFKLANEALARQGLISFTKHKRPISSEDLEVPYVANQLGLNPPESFANSTWFNIILYFGKRGRENQREMIPGALQLNNNNKPAEVLHLKRESDENQSTFKCSRFYIFCVSRS